MGRGKVRNVKKKVTPKGFDEASRTTRVKMYKSGKQWVQCLLTRLGMIKLSSGVKPEEVRVEANLDSKTTSLLKGVLAASALIGGGAVATPHAFAEVQTSTVDSGADNNTSQNLAEANTVSLGSNNDSTGAKSQTSDSASLSMSESGSQSTTESASDSKSDSRSTSQDTTSESASVSASESVATSASMSLSNLLATQNGTKIAANDKAIPGQAYKPGMTVTPKKLFDTNRFLSFMRVSKSVVTNKSNTSGPLIKFSYTGLGKSFDSVIGIYDVGRRTISWSVTINASSIIDYYKTILGFDIPYFKFNPYEYLYIAATNGQGNNLLSLQNENDRLLGEGAESSIVHYQIEGESQVENARIGYINHQESAEWSGGITYRTNEMVGEPWFGKDIGGTLLYTPRSTTFTFETKFLGENVTDLVNMKLYLSTWTTASLFGDPNGGVLPQESEVENLLLYGRL